MEKIEEIQIKQIKCLDNSRLRTDSGNLATLMEDIKHRGLLQPIKVSKQDNSYVILFGNRRLEACRKLGWKTISCIVTKTKINKERFMADNIAENFHREDLTPFEIANGANQYIKQGYSIGEISVLTSIPKNKIISCMKMIRSAPKQFKKAISFVKGREDKKGRIATSVANEIFNESYSNLSKTQKGSLLNKATKDGLTSGQIRLMKYLMAQGLSFTKAKTEYKKYQLVGVTIPLKKSELKKYEIKSFTNFISCFIQGLTKPNKKLIA